MKTALITLLLLSSILVSNLASAQNKRTMRNTVYAEAFGQGFVYGSLHYDRIVNFTQNTFQTLDVGVAFMPEALDFGEGRYIGVPICYNFVFGKRSPHHLMLGFGATPMLIHSKENKVEKSNFDLYVTPKIGYRYQHFDGGLFINVSVNGMMSVFRTEKNSATDRSERMHFKNTLNIGSTIFPWPGVSVGYTFKR